MSRRKSIYIRSEPQEIIADKQCRTRTAIAGQAVAGCMIAGKIGVSSAAIPNGTFNENTL